MNWINDLRFSLRHIAKNWETSAMIVLMMAVGIGSSTTMFAFVRGILWSPIDLDKKDRLIHFEWDPLRNPDLRNNLIHISDFEDFQTSAQTIEKMAGYMIDNPAFSYPEGNRYAEGQPSAAVTSDFFAVIQKQALHGRTFIKEDYEPGRERALVLSWELWQEQFEGSLKALEAKVSVNGIPARIVGIMPRGFTFPLDIRLWWAASFDWTQNPARTHGQSLFTIAKPREGYTLKNVQAELDTIAASLQERYPNENRNKRYIRVTSFRESISGGLEGPLMALFGCSLMILLLSCANVSNLMLARTAKRSFELAVRSSVGAKRSQILFQIVLDSFLLTFFGALIGTLIAAWGARLIWTTLSVYRLPYWWKVEIDGYTLLAVIGLAILSTLLASMIPALRAARRDSFSLLRDDSRTSSGLVMGHLAKVLAGVQIALAGALMLVAMAMVLIFTSNQKVKYSQDLEKILQASVFLNSSTGFPSPESAFRFHREFREHMMQEYGAEEVAFTSGFGVGQFRNRPPFEIRGEVYETPESRPRAGRSDVTPEYFELFGLGQVLSGRLFTEQDVASSEKVVVINRMFASIFFPDTDPIGRQIRVDSHQETDWLTIVGVCENYVDKPLPGQPRDSIAAFYRPITQNLERICTILVKSRNDPKRLMEPLRKSLRKLAPDVAPQGPLRTSREIMDIGFTAMNLNITIFTVFGIVSFLMAVVGLYSVLSFSAVQRTREFGIRRALGAKMGSILLLVLRQGVIYVLLGTLLGVTAGYGILGFIMNSLFRASFPGTGLLYAVTLVLLLLSSFVSMLIPALRAAKLDPLVALRHG